MKYCFNTNLKDSHIRESFLLLYKTPYKLLVCPKLLQYLNFLIHDLGFNGFIDVDNVSEDNSTDSQLCK